MAGQMLYVKKKEEIDVAKANVVFSRDNEYYTPKYVVDFSIQMDLTMTQQHVREKQKNLKYLIMTQ